LNAETREDGSGKIGEIWDLFPGCGLPSSATFNVK
jgi:hypothetical protein